MQGGLGRTLIIDGRNNHDWRSTTDHLRATLEAAGRFDVTVSTAPELRFPNVPRKARRSEDWPALTAAREHFEKPQAEAKADLAPRWEKWAPDFKSNDVVIMNYNGDEWSAGMRRAFVDFVRSGGGVVLVHGANNAFRNWPEFNEMIGLGWRPALIGKAIKIDPDSGKTYIANEIDLPNNGNSSHGSKHAFQVTVRAPEHPIMQGLRRFGCMLGMNCITTCVVQRGI